MKLPQLKFSTLSKSAGADGKSFVRKHPGLVLYLLITLLITSLYFNNASMFESVESKIQDVLFRVREVSQPSGEVVLLAIDNRSLDHIGRWPWNHQRMAQLVEALAYYSPKAVVLQPQVKENVEDYISGTSQLLAENILQSENIILPFFPIISSRTPKTSTAPSWLERSALKMILPFEGEYVPPASKLELPADQFGPSGRLSGAIWTRFDPDNTVRKQPMLVKYERFFYPSIELAAAAFAMDVPFDDITFDQELGKLHVGNREIPVDEKGSYRINYYGPPLTFPTYSVRDFWDGEIAVEDIQGKVVVVALTALGLSDELSTPLGDDFTVAEKSASVIDNILTGRFISPLSASSNAEILVILAIGIFCAAMLPRVSLIYRLVILVVFAFVIVNLNFILFTSFNTMANTFFPTLEILLFALAAPLLTQHTEKKLQTNATQRVKTDGRTEDRVEKLAVRDSITPLEEVTLAIDTPAVETQMFKSLARAVESSKTPIPPRSAESGRAPRKPESAQETSLSSLGRYEVIDVLGEGAMGTVYKGKDPAIGRMVALKTIRLDKLADSSEIEELRERLMREAKAAGSLSHPNIVTIYDVGNEGDLQYIAMEFLEGYTLEQIIRRQLELNFKIAAKIVFQVCSALSYAHRHGIVHRDIKPANIMVLENFHVKVMDFGIAHFGSSNLTQTGIAMGTPNYISPEQLKGEPVTSSSDIFSLGVVFYEILTGKKPFVGENISNLILKITTENPVPPSSLDAKIPPILDLIVKKALNNNPYDRYQSADEMARAMEDFVTSFTGTAAKF
jgi:CHASE2 domain-containing sensor protein/tRNA A-37 threonylcarbamoyl transferase component Bud32